MSNPRAISTSIEIVNPNAKDKTKEKGQAQTYSAFSRIIGSPDDHFFRLSASMPDSLWNTKKTAVASQDSEEESSESFGLNPFNSH